MVDRLTKTNTMQEPLTPPDYKEPIQLICSVCDGKGIIPVIMLGLDDEPEPCDRCEGTGIIEISAQEHEEQCKDAQEDFED
jgi:DnaJ-class molecular chaperone